MKDTITCFFQGNAEMCRLLIYSGFNPKQRDNFGQTPLHLGALSGNLNCVKVLVEQEVELEAVDFNGNSPRKLAEGRKHWETVRYLERAAARNVSEIILYQISMEDSTAVVCRVLRVVC